jgi:hypothetical protein
LSNNILEFHVGNTCRIDTGRGRMPLHPYLRRSITLALALGCGALAIAWPAWRAELADLPSSGYGPEELELTCELKDPQTEEPTVAFYPGDKVLLHVSLQVPEEAMEQEIRVQVAIVAKVARFKLSVNLGNWTVQVPTQSEREQIEGYENAEEHLPTDFSKEITQRFKLPKKLPVSEATIKVIGFVEGFEKKVCKLTIEILD